MDERIDSFLDKFSILIWYFAGLLLIALAFVCAYQMPSFDTDPALHNLMYTNMVATLLIGWLTMLIGDLLSIRREIRRMKEEVK